VNKSGRCGETLTATEFDVEKRLIEETGKISTREEIHDKIRKTLLDWKPSTERTAWEVFVANEIIANTGQSLSMKSAIIH
jgi:DNA-binding response OmpR family regulator